MKSLSEPHYRYTGAPYFCAQSSLITVGILANLYKGAELAFVVCTDDAAVTIKNYSPDLIVYPCYKVKRLLSR